MASQLLAESENPRMLLKEAAAALDEAQTRDEATKIAFAMVEKGKIPPFESYEALQEKIASLMNKDLRVVREALDMDVDLPDLGKVASEDPEFSDDATAAFYHRLAD